MSFEAYHKGVEEREKKDREISELKEQMVKMEESQLKITELLEVMKIAKSSDGKIGKDRTMLDEKRRVTIGYVDNNNQSVEMKVPLEIVIFLNEGCRNDCMVLSASSYVHK